MSRVKNKALLKWFSIISTGLVTFILLLLTWLYTTESGLQWLVARTTSLQPQELSIGKISGTLNSKLRVAKLEWQKENTRLQVTGLEVDCQWLHLLDKLVFCEAIILQKVNVLAVSDSQSATPQDALLPNLPTVNLPVKVNIKKVSIAAITYKQLSAEIVNFKGAEPEVIAEHKITKLTIKKLTLAGSKVKVGALSLDVDEHNITGSGDIDMRKKWQHQLAFNVVGPKLAVSAKSKGRITELSQLTLQLKSPNQMLVTTDWFYNQGLFLKRGLLKTEQQQLEIADQSVGVEHANATFELNWPTLTTHLQAQVKYQAIENVKFEVRSELPNIMDWRASAEISLLVNSELSESLVAESLQQVFPDANKNNLATKESWPVLANIDMTINQGLLVLKSSEIKFGELTAVLQGQFNVDSPTTENLLIKGQLNGRSLHLENAIALANIDAHWRLEKQQSKWQLASTGKVAEISVENFSGKNIQWALDFSENWQADIKADALQVNDIDIGLLSLNVTGDADSHKMIVGATIDKNIPLTLSFDGQLLQQQGKPFDISHEPADTLWKISQLKFKAIKQDQSFLLAAEQLQLSTKQQQIKNLCLNGSGKFCLNAEHSNSAWSANLNFEQWQISPVFEQFTAWQAALSVQTAQIKSSQSLQGSVTGQLTLQGKGEKLADVTADLSLPYVKWQSPDLNVDLQNLTIKSQQQQNSIEILTQWQTLTSNLQLPQGQSEIVMPNGVISLSLTPDFKVNFGLEQADMTLSVPVVKADDNLQASQRILTIPLVSIQGSWQEDKISSLIDIRLPAQDNITAKLNSEWPLVDSARISGDFALSLQQFDWLKYFQKGIDKIDISLVQNFTVAGTLAKPLFDGEGALTINHLAIDEYGLDIRDSKIKLSSQQDNIIVVGELKNPQGSLAINGQAKLSNPIMANLTIEGQKVTLVNNNDNTLIVSPKLTANFQDKHLVVEGHLLVDQAVIKVTSLPKPAINVSEDQVIVDEKVITVNDSAFSHSISVTIATGENVHISGFGLTSEIHGNLSSQLISGQPLVLNGRLDLKDGKFEAYKQTLTIEQGQLLFLGTAENPSIQFRAVRIVDDVKVGILANGTISKPRLTLFSEPTMADENILALLITGRNLSSLSQQEGNALTSAAISLGVESANKLVQKIGDQLGLKDVGVTSKSGNNGNSTRVDIAAKINDRLHVGYGTNIDADNGVQPGWNIEYKLSPSISFEATSGDEINANINYKKQFSTTKEKAKVKANAIEQK